MRVLVTGASGFVGRAVLAELFSRGHEVIAVYGPATDIPPASDDRIRFAKADVGDENSVLSLTKLGPLDVIIHAAGIAHRFGKTPDAEYQRVNVQGVKYVAELCAKLKTRRFVLISSVLVYGRGGRIPGRPVTEEDSCQPTDVYARSKFEAELAASEVCRRNDVPISILRPAPIIGEGSKGNFSRLIGALHSGRFVWVGAGSNQKSLVYVGDVARAAVYLAESSNEDHEIYNVAAKPAAMRDIVNSISFNLGKKPPRIAVPPFLLMKALRLAQLTPIKSIADRFYETLQTWLAEDVYSCERLSNTHKLKPSISIPEAISREVRYYLSKRW